MSTFLFLSDLSLKILPFFLAGVFINFFISSLWKKNFFRSLGLKNYRADHRVHEGEVPRLGGLVIFSLFLIFFLNFSDIEISNFVYICSLSLIPACFASIKEDLFHNVRPALRFLALLLSATLFVIYFKSELPSLSNTFLSPLFSLKIMYPFFYIIALVAIANGCNLLDGMNGLCAISVIASLVSLFIISMNVGDLQIMTITFVMTIIILSFFAINYPLGKIFLGDFGAYFLGLFLGMFTIIFFGKHNELSRWLAVLVLIYPFTEVSFSLFRRLFSRRSIYKPDNNHLHSLVYLTLKNNSLSKSFANPGVLLSMVFFWAYPILSIYYCLNRPYLIGIFIFSYFALYLIVYSYLNNFVKNTK